MFSTLIALTLVGACESDVKKLERLQREKNMAVLRELFWEQNWKHNSKGADSLKYYRTKRQLADRELALFMSGRD